MHKPPAPLHWHPFVPAQAARALRPGQAHLCLFSLDQPPLPASRLAALLGRDEQERASRFHFDTDRRRFETGRGLLRWVVGHYAGVEPDAVRFAYGSHGKPCLDGPASGPALEFNISHSGAWALIGLSLGVPIGVDIEVMRDVPERLEIARSNFAPAELRELLQLPLSERPAGFLACWTRKEAYVKALGGGLSVPLEQFEVSLDPAVPATFRTIGGSAAAAGEWALLGLEPMHGLWVAAAVKQFTLDWILYRAEGPIALF